MIQVVRVGTNLPREPVFYVGRSLQYGVSSLGNQFHDWNTPGGRQVHVQKFREDIWLWPGKRRLEELKKLHDYHEKHGELYLACHCTPLSCHAHVIKEILENWQTYLEKVG